MTDSERDAMYNVAVPQLEELVQLQRMAKVSVIKPDVIRYAHTLRQLLFEAIPLVDDENPDHEYMLMNGETKRWLRNVAEVLKERI